MKKLGKKIIALAAMASMVMTLFVGCGSVKDNAVVFTVGKTEVTADLVKFYGNYLQPQYEAYMVSMMNYQYEQYYGSSLGMTELDWDTQYTEDATYEEDFKENYVMSTLKDLYLAKLHMSEYKVELTDAEVKEIEEAAKTFDKANDEKAKEKVSANKKLATEYLTLRTIYEKVNDAILETVDREVDPAEANQKAIRYTSFAKTKTDEKGSSVKLSDDEVAKVKKEAEDFLAAAKANGSLETYAKEKEATATKENFGADYKDDTALALDDKIYEAANAMTEVGFMELQETDDAFYVVQLESLYDEEATKTEKENIIAKRESDKVAEVFKAWEKDTKVVVNEKVWDKIKFGSLKVEQKEEKKEEKEESKEETSEAETKE